MSFRLPPLYPILDQRYFPEEPAARTAFLHQTVREFADAGVSILQLREKNATIDQVLRDAEAMRQAAPATMRLILNDYPGLLRKTGFDGVHLGQNDLAVDAARALVGPESILGLSTHTPQQVRAGDLTEADYLATGPVFATTSKADAQPAIGLEGVRAARRNTGKPLVAIGGITLQQAESVWAAGADSIAVIGALFAGNASPGRFGGDFLKLFR